MSDLFYPKDYDEYETLVIKNGLLRGNAKTLRQQIQLMLAVAGAVFPMLPEVKRTLAVRYCPCSHQAMHFMGVHMSYRPTGANITA